MVSQFYSDREIASMQRTQERAMNKTCVIRNTPEVEDNKGGTTAGTPVDTNSICRIGVPSEREQIIAERIGVIADVALTLPAAMLSVISETSLVLVPDASAPTDTYSVVSINREQSYLAATRAICQRVK